MVKMKMSPNTKGKEKVISFSKWDDKNKILFTRISGVCGFEDVKVWEKELLIVSGLIPANTQFKFLVNESGYGFENVAVHKFKREIMPRLLASFGLELALLSKEELEIARKEVKINKQGIRCIAVAMVHHDKLKMANLHSDFGNDREKYCSDYDQAYDWISHFTI